MYSLKKEATMKTHDVIRSQFHAALAMLRQTIERCPDSLWIEPTPTQPFWHIAYHTLFYTHLYLQPTEADFSPWTHHRKDIQSLGKPPWSPRQQPSAEEVYTKTQVLDYLAFCAKEVDAQIPALDLEAASGFHWLPFSKLELQIYSIRHLQQHNGELDERLGQQGIEVNWVGRGPSI
jgi:hypothetical protein